MKIIAHQNIKVGDIVAGYLNDPNIGGVTAYGGRLNGEDVNSDNKEEQSNGNQ